MAGFTAAVKPPERRIGYLPNDASPWGERMGLALRHGLAMFLARSIDKEFEGHLVENLVIDV